MYKLHCDFCNEVIEARIGEGYLSFKGKAICTQCAMELIEPIYQHDICSGGLISMAFETIVKEAKKRKV